MIERDARGLVAAITVLLSFVALVALAAAVATRPEPEVRAPSVVSIDAGIERVDAGAAEVAPTPRVEVPYALDDLPRDGAQLAEGCPEVPLVDHAGDPVPWRPALRVHPALVPAVRALERAIVETAILTYHRAPIRILSASSHRCRTMRGNPTRISEHALGNAVDLRGIVLDEGEEITIRDHWSATGEDAIHVRFWHALVRRMIDEQSFRGIVGPPRADHLDHLHFDHGRSRFTDVELP
ncbi:extensin family protein [Sandaracinus amylolyticus]|uniref:Extensin-like C-terminal domain-containing protein n=1 Tax=Sandaracinus amylolyticus TaxID=927083 RepID=A0A0F6SHJ2_9BACT|nr:extensin family protein [Sandaracinus amylolyticus]AKF10539.1 hypothetical protein DB32_007688 [Sandaracinus amylolyticus]